MFEKLFHRWCAVAVILVLAVMGAVAESVWIEDGRSRITVVVDEDVLNIDPDGRAASDRRPLSWAAHDLVDYLEKMTGVRPSLAAEAAPDTIPVRIRTLAEGETMEVASQFRDAYRITHTADGTELIGEDPSSAAYAVYQLLDDLGVRWYGPAEWAEVVPRYERIAFDASVRDFTPHFHTRNLWIAGQPRWFLRNRMNGRRMPEGHAFHRFMQGMEPRDAAPLVERHPEFYPIVDGRVRNAQANLSHPGVIHRAVTWLRAHFERNPHVIGETIGPDDGHLHDERPESRALMTGKPDPLMKVQDASDLFIHFANSVAEALEDEYPDKVLGFYVYSNHQTVPTVKPHPNLFPTVAPIGFSRYTSIGAPQAPTAMLLKEIIQQWSQLSPRMGFYLYNFNLADLAMPFTRVAAFRRDIPNLYRWGLEYASIESMNNWHTMIPGNYMIANLLWDVDTDVDALLDEFYQLYYGQAATAMREYDLLLEDAYENTSAYAGNLWSMHGILTPAVMEGLEQALARAREKVGSDEPYATRLRIPSYSLQFAEAWFSAREALNRFEFTQAAEEHRRFMANFEAAHGEFPDFFVPVMERYWRIFHQPTFEDAERLDNEGTRLMEFPDVWKCYFDDTLIGESLNLQDPRSPKSTWLDFKTYSATIDEQGFPYYRGNIWYALDVEIPEFSLDDNEHLFLWFGGNDNDTRVFIDGQLAGGFHTANFQPREVAVTPHIRSGARHHVVVAVNNQAIHELGTGGIMRPVTLYRRKLREGETVQVTPFIPRSITEGPLFAPEL